MLGMSGKIPGSFEAGEIKQIVSRRMATFGSNIDVDKSGGTQSQQAKQAGAGKSGKTAAGKQGAETREAATTFQAKTTGAAGDQVQFSSRMPGKLVQLRRQAIKMRHFRDGLESKLMGFLTIDPSPEQIKQAARFAAATIWDILKRARVSDDDDDKEITAHLLALLMKIHSAYTFEHSERVMDWTVALGEEIGIEDESELHNLGQAAFFRDIGMLGGAIADGELGSTTSLGNFLEDSKNTLMECGSLHDIGKMRIPQEIINKAAPLTEEEYAIIKTHPLIGVEIVKPYPSLHRAIPGILHHHEKWNGKGYPKGFAGKKIPLAARIITVTDTFDAMTEDRPYRKGLTYNEAIIELIRLSGEQFDPELVPPFVRVLVKKGEITREELEEDPDIDTSKIFQDEIKEIEE